jgi:D-alanyl-D-alanine carboxypeptidase (penicillin-binding protein 5/6)
MDSYRYDHSMHDMRRRLWVVILLSCCCFSSVIEGAERLNVSASSAVVMDQQTGQVLWAKNPDWKRPMASLTKIMTAILILENCDLDDTVTISREAACTPGSSMNLRAGTTYQVRDLLYGLMLLSGNDAAAALAEHSGGRIDEFVAMMNKKALLLGATNTNFANPHGLPDEKHYSTAHDLALLTRSSLAIPEFAALVASDQAVIPDPMDAAHLSIYNKNRLLWEFEGANGVKTGYTLKAGRCLVASATRYGRQVVAVILDAPRLWEDAVTLLNYGLEEHKNIMIAQKGQELGTASVQGGLKGTVAVVSGNDVWITAPKAQSEAAKIDYVISGEIMAPVEKWAPLGKLRVMDGEKLLLEAPLLAGEQVVERSWAGRLRHFVHRLRRLLVEH